jgi:hypothetical protein
MNRTFALVSSAAALALTCLGSSGCKTCDVHDEDGSASGQLTYTESLASRDARVGRIDGDHWEGDVRVAADRARGRDRVVAERRVPDNHVLATSSAFFIDSDLTTTFEVNGNPITISLSGVSLRVDRPAAGGTYQLESLHAEVCEHFERAGKEVVDVCAGAGGTIDYRLVDGGFSADITLTPAAAVPEAANVTGSLHVSYQEKVDTEVCPDLGGGGAHGAFAP